MRRSGQVIILTVLMLGSSLLGAAGIAALLMLYQIRQTTDFANSGRAIAAADAGVEWVLYQKFNPGGSDFFQRGSDKIWTATLENGSSVKLSCFKDAAQVECDDPDMNSARSVAASKSTSRAFRLSF